MAINSDSPDVGSTSPKTRHAVTGALFQLKYLIRFTQPCQYSMIAYSRALVAQKSVVLNFQDKAGSRPLRGFSQRKKFSIFNMKLKVFLNVF